MRRTLLAILVALPILAAVPACTDPAPSKPGCAVQKAADEATVRTTRWQPASQLADLGEYVEIHWQERALGDPCSRAPGPTDRTYQGVVTLRPDDASALAARPGWQPATPEVWPALATFVPAGTTWQRAAAAPGAPTLYLAPASALALFVVTTS